jgi:5-formyltetrahydrofolate cyclo-ligase
MGETDNKLAKNIIRKEIISKLRGQKPSVRDDLSFKIQKKLVSTEYFVSAKTIMVYMALPEEVDTAFLIEEIFKTGKKVVIPVIDNEKDIIVPVYLTSMDNLVKGRFGIAEPEHSLREKVNLEEIDLIVTPAIAYDIQNKRLGRGRGYYDRFLASCELSSTNTIGPAFRFQIVNNLPTDPHDLPVTLVLTD